MNIVAISFVAVFILFGSGGLLLFYREAMLQRISAVVNPPRKKPDLRDALQQTGSAIGDLLGELQRVLPKSEAELSVVGKRLVRAGFRRDSAVRMFYSAKILTPLLICVLFIVTGFAGANPFFGYALALGVGFILPDFWLGRKIKKRQKKIELGLPDTLDFLVICIEAGLSLDQATARAAEELKLSRPDISDELDLVVLEHRAGRPRADAWKNFAERTDVEAIRVLAGVLVQSEQLGTTVSKTLRVHSDSLRVLRRQQVEEQAAKTTVKLVFPLVLCIFPSLFVVVLGPSAIIMSESFARYFH